MKPKPTWAMILLMLACAIGTFREVARPDKDWRSIVDGAMTTMSFGVIAWSWAKRNEEL